jgi:hypothetical protein
MTRTIRIGGASGYWGDSNEAPRQLVMRGELDYLVFDYLAEVTMSILARAKAKDPDQGYARDFVDLAMKPLIHEIKARGIKVVVNSGGVNVAACAAALAKVAADAGVDLKIGTVEGDDLMDRMEGLRAGGITEMFSGAPLPDKLASANAYLGAFPIAAALDKGADVVITGRCVDSAVTLGPLIHEFGWTAEEFDKLAAGTLAGHILECGAQATGGNFTDWRDVVDGWDDMGYPIAECRGDGTFIVTKPEGTCGLVSRLSVGEQILYEIGDPAAYIMPDVVCDFGSAVLTGIGPNQVEVSGVKGRAPTPTFKVSATYMGGYRATALTVITGFDAVVKAQAFSDALIKRTRRLFRERNLPDYQDTATHLIGAETLWGANASPGAAEAREVVMQIDVRHLDRMALDLFSKETTGVALSMSTGRCSAGSAGRPKVMPVIAQFAFMIDKSRITQTVKVDGADISFEPPQVRVQNPEATPQAVSAVNQKIDDPVEVPLIRLAVARSGDKGNSANVGVMARSPDYMDLLRQALTPQSVRGWFAHFVEGDVMRYEAPGFDALNFVLTESLGGGGTSSLHLDSQAKTYGQQILAMPVEIPRVMYDALRPARPVK